MFNVFHRCYKFAVAIILGFLVVTFAHAESERAEGIFILDVDGSGEVDALTDGLLIIRSMFGFKGDSLTSGAVDLTNCTDCDSDSIDLYLSGVKSATSGNLNSYDDQNISGSGLTGTVLTIGIERGSSETVDLSSLAAGNGITSDQASAITANTAKTGISSDQASAITANTAKTGISSDQATAITANTAKTGITADQASAITANTAKSGTDDQNISGSGLSGTTLTIGIEGGNSETVNLSSLTSGFSVVPRVIAASLTSTGMMKTFYSQFSSQKTMTVSKISVWGGNFSGGDGSGVTVVAGLYKGVLGDGTFSGNLVGQGSVTTSGTERLEISLTAESGQNLSITELEDLVFAVSISSSNYNLRTFCPSTQNRLDTSRSNSSYFASLPSDPSGSAFQCFPAFYVH